MMKVTYDQFTQKAAAGRKMEVAKLEGLAQGRVFTGRMAVANGLADQLGTLEDAMAEVRTMAGVKPEDKLETLVLPKPRGLLESLFGGSQIEAEARAISPELVDTIKTGATLQKLFSEPAVLMMPYLVRIR